MQNKKTRKLNFLAIKIVGFLCLSSFIGVNAQQVFEDRTVLLETSYLESKDELEDYILDTGDGINIRFENRPRKGLKKGLEKKISKGDILYLEPRNSLDQYVLDTDDSIFIDFKNVQDFTGTYRINKEGEVYLPRIKDTYIKGLTMPELEILLEKRYEEYLVSPDIQIRINGFKFIPNGNFVINPEGEIKLPKIPTDPDEKTRATFVRGLTIKELEILLEKRYSKYLINPKVFIDISQFKPLRISLRGEVRAPGLVKFPVYKPSNFLQKNLDENERGDNDIKYRQDKSAEITSFDKEIKSNKSKINNTLNSNQFSLNKNINSDSEINSKNNIKRDSLYISTLSNAIQKSGGLTSYSDISKIQIVRDIPIGKGGGKKRAEINFLSYINEADDTYDIRLFDGDDIFIPRLQERDVSIIPKSILSGLSPKFISVSIGGQIENPGTVQIPIEGSLSDVMNLTGPRKPLSGKIYLIRYNQDGTLLRKNISYSSSATPGSPKNPFLLAGDLITVKNSILGRTSGTLKAITEPFVGIYATKEVVETIGQEF